MMVRPREIIEGALHITFHNRLETVMNYFMDYKQTIDMTTIDIPEFLKPEQDRYVNRVKKYISDLITYSPEKFWGLYDEAVRLGF